jgi:SAM-dependent methyltransferase
MKTILPLNNRDQDLLRLPFDQYGRYRMIREALEATRPLVGERLRILDVGGFFRTARGEAVLPGRMFLPDDDVTVVDQAECDLPGYMRGDGRGLDFAERSFDFVISCDTLEHVPAPDRPGFWQELLRVAGHGVLLAAPFASPEVVAAEALLVAYIQAEHGVEHAMLTEHHDYGLPELSAMRALLDAMNLRHRAYPSGYVHAWLAMMVAKHTTALGDLAIYEQLDAYYTRFFGPDERREPAYRHLLLVARPGQNTWLDAADRALAPTIRENAAGPGWPDLATWLIQLASLRHDTLAGAAQQQALAALAHTVAAQHQALAAREAQIADLEARAHWLDGQARAAREALAAVERGRILRLLGWAQRRRR